MERERSNKTLMIKVFAILMSILMMVSFFVSIPVALAQSNNETVKLRDINYEGSNNYCKYSLYMESKALDGTNVLDSDQFKIYLRGEDCKRNIFTTFTYDLTFTLILEDSSDIHTEYFKVDDVRDVLGDERIIFANISTPGNYILHITGQIRSNVKVDVNEVINFSIL